MADNAHTVDHEPDFNTDFGLDPSDPLYMLLNNANDTKSELPGAPFDFPFPMDLDFNDPSFSVFVDPNALFMDSSAPLQSPPTVPIQPQDLLNAPFPFTFAPPTPSSASSSSHSADEGPSSSGFSSSPGSPPSTRASPAAPVVPKSTADAVSAFFSQSNRPLNTPMPSYTVAQYVQQPPLSSPSPPLPIQPTQVSHTHMMTSTVVTARPKTSHTTIERRYRTNLNARIQSLKAAVPALRVLDQNYRNDEYKVDDRGYIDGVKVARKGSKANVLGKAVEYIRVLKRREARLKREQDGLRSLICGFPGGQNILTEWVIEWVKKFGGPERDEIDNEGVEDASDEEDGDGDGEDDVDNSERARKKPKIESKKEKRRIAPATAILPGTTSGVPVAAPIVVEKRKRGRPRKIQPNVPPPITAAAPVILTDPAQQQGIVLPPPVAAAPQPQQYLLAVFALFSFFNSPLTSSPGPVPHHHTHQGSVLSHTTSASPVVPPAIGWTLNDVVQFVHLLASLAVFVSIVVPWIPVPRKAYQSRLMQMIPLSTLIYGPHSSNFSTHEISDLPTPPDSPDISDVGSEPDSSSTEYTVRAKGQKESSSPLLDALNSRGATKELENLLGALNVTSGWFGVVRQSVGSWHARNGPGMRSERLAWTRLAELILLSPDKIPMSLRWQVYHQLSPWSTSSVTEVASESLISELCTLSLIAQTLPFTESRSQALWTRATALAKSTIVPTYQRLVFDTITVDEAVECLETSESTSGSSPIASLASILLRKCLHRHASSLFVHRVSQDRYSNSEFPSIEDSKTWRATIRDGRSLGGDIGMLSDAFAEVWRDAGAGLDIDALEVDAVNEDVGALLRATVLYDRVFVPRSVLSPPPSPPSKAGGKGNGNEADVVLQLRQALGSSVFEESGETSSGGGLLLEDARDRVVDMIVNLQRERRTRVG